MLIKILVLWILINFIVSNNADSVDNLTVSVVVPEHTLKEINLHKFINSYRLDYISHFTQFPNLWKKITLKTVIWPTYPTIQYVLDTFCNEILQNNVSAIIIAYKYDTDVIQFRYLLQLSNDAGIPVIIKNTISDLGSPQPSVILETNPSVADEAKATLFILSRFQFREICVIRSYIEDGKDLHRELNAMQKISTFSFKILSHIKLRASENIELMTGRMFDIKMMYPQCRVIVLHISKAEAQQMFPAAKKVGLTGREYQWIVTRSVYTHYDKEEPYFPVGTLAIYYDLFDEQLQVSLSKLRISDKLEKHFDYLTDILGKQNKPFNNQWIFVIGNSFQILESGLENYLTKSNNNRLEDLKPDVNCERNTLKQRTTGSALHKLFPDNKVMDIFQINPQQDWIFTELQFMTSVENKKQVNYNITVLENPPFVITSTPGYGAKCKLPEVECKVTVDNQRFNSAFVPSNHGDHRCCSGLFIDLLVTLSASLNFTYNLRVNDGQWGKKINGIYEALENVVEKAHLILSTVLPSEFEHRFICSNVILNASIAIMVAKKTEFPPMYAILQPFDILNWFVIVFVFIQVETWLIFAFEWLSPNGLNMKKILPQNHHFTLTQTYWLTLTMLFKAPMRTISPRGWSSLAIANSWAAFALIFIAIYTAKLTNFMIATESHYKFKGITDEKLLKSDIKVGTVSDESTAVILQYEFPQLYQRMKPFNRVNVSEGIKALKSRELDAFIYEGVVLDYYTAKDCELITLDNRYVKFDYGILSTWNDFAEMNNIIDRLVESGTISGWRDRWVGEPCKPNSNFQSISFDQFRSAFILLGVGITIAAIIFVLEHCYMKRVNRKQRTKEIVNSWWNLITQAKLPVRDGLDEVSHLPSERD